LDGGLNPYAYPENPVNIIDPLGLEPGKCYPTIDAAAAAALTQYNQQSNSEHREFAGRINKEGSACYKYTPPVKGTLTSVAPPPAGANDAGVYHTHPSCSHTGLACDSENFSPEDIGYAHQENATSPNGSMMYVSTPRGVLKKYNPNTGRIINIAYPP
jgi:uncharacterized protein RhaS with RHS repeats